MGHIFYILGLMIGIMNISSISNHYKIFKTKNWVSSFLKVTKKLPIKSDYKSDYDIFIKWSYTTTSSTIWFFLGLITNSWPIFFILLIIKYSSNNSTRLLGYNHFTSTIILLHEIVTTLTIFLLIINHFHLHQDLIKLL
jgi:hypothetical protein